MQKIKVLSIEDSPIIRERLSGLFLNSNEFELIGIFRHAEHIFDFLSVQKPDIMLVDLELPGMSGEELIMQVRQIYPEIQITVFTAFEEQRRIFRLMKAGIRGYLLKDSSDELLLAELNVIRLGGAPLTEKVAQMILDEIPAADRSPGDVYTSTPETEKKEAENPLSEKEFQVLNLIALGLKYREIADDLNTSPHTIRRHIENIYRKLESKSKVQALRTAEKLGIL